MKCCPARLHRNDNKPTDGLPSGHAVCPLLCCDTAKITLRYEWLRVGLFVCWLFNPALYPRLEKQVANTGKALQADWLDTGQLGTAGLLSEQRSKSIPLSLPLIPPSSPALQITVPV
ncbi:unnamed protein product [Boreogadus saida]